MPRNKIERLYEALQPNKNRGKTKPTQRRKRRNPRQPSHKPKAKEQELHGNHKGGCGAKITILNS